MEDSCRNLILEYLLHNCYGNAAKAFISDMRNLDMLNMDTSMLDKNGNVIHNLSGNNTSDTHDSNGDIHDRITDSDMEWMTSSHVDENHERAVHLSTLNGAANKVQDEDQWSQLEARKELYYSIQRGDIPKAFELLNEHFSVLISPTAASSRKVLFRLNCQRFIEIVRLGETLEALKFAQTTLRAIKNDLSINGTPEEIETLSAISSLIAYQNPDQSPIAKYLDQSFRDETADIVNNAVLALVNLPVETRLAKIVRQMTVVRAEISALSAKDEAPTPYDDIGNILQL